MSESRYAGKDKRELLFLLSEKDRELEKLWHLLSQANKRVFGKKSEKLTESLQQSLFTFEIPEAPPLPEKIKIPEHTRIKNKGRKPLPQDIPRHRIEHEPEDKNCACCGKELKRIGEEITEELDYIPAHFIINEHVKGKYACSYCKDKVQTAELPVTSQPLERSRPGIGLLVYIILSKYVDHIPLYRLEKMFLRQGIELSRQRMSDWLAAVVPKFYILYERLKLELLATDYLQADETRIRVKDWEDDHKYFLGYFWCMHSPELKLALFHFFDTRGQEAAENLFKDFKGTLQADGYSGYNSIVIPSTVQRLACLAHIRRRFIEAQKIASKECGLVLEYIAELYKVEKRASDKKLTPDERRDFRKKYAAPLLEALEKHLLNIKLSALPKSFLMEAVQYALNQWGNLILYLEDGRYHLDNNAMEREIRPIAIGRKNYLFAGSPQGAQRAAILYSFIACCRLNKVNPHVWFSDVLKLLLQNSIQDLTSLLPHRWKPSAP